MPPPKDTPRCGARRHAAVGLSALLLAAACAGCQSSAVTYRERAHRAGQRAAEEARAYVARDESLAKRPSDRDYRFDQIRWLEQATASAARVDVAATEPAWEAVAPLLRAYVTADANLDAQRRQALLDLAQGFDRLNRAERGRQAAWTREQRWQFRVEPN